MSEWGDPCAAGETCLDAPAPATGYACEDTDGCEGDPCQTGETCLDVVAPGTGYTCEDTNGCEGDPCQTGETCMDVAAPGTGYMCTDDDGCLGDPSGPGETCSDIVAPSTGYMCTDTDECDPNPCDTGETCTDAVAPATGYTCADTDECLADPCQTGENCTDAVAPATGYTCTEIDGCEGITCGTGEYCLDMPAPSTGYSCEDVDGCENISCGTGVCVDMAAPELGFACDYTQQACAATAATISNAAPLVEMISVPSTYGTVVDVDLSLDISHTSVGDLTIQLDHGAQSASVAANSCGASEDINATFDDDGSPPACGTPALAGVITPATPFATFNDTVAAGDWMLSVFDGTPAVDGSLNQWCVDVTSSYEPHFPATPDTTLRGSSNGTAVDQMCPERTVLIGMNVYSGGYINGLQPICGVPALTPGGSGADAAAITETVTLDWVGTTSGTLTPLLLLPPRKIAAIAARWERHRVR